MNRSIFVLLMASIAQNSYADSTPEALSLELDVSWNSSSLNASIQMTIPEPSPEAMFANSSIHQVVVNTDEETVFIPNQLNASIGDTVMFTPVNLGNRIFQITLDRPCQADDSLSAINFSGLVFPSNPTNSHYYKYHARPQPSQRYQTTYDKLTAKSKKQDARTDQWDSIENLSMTSQKVQMRDTTGSAGLRVVNVA